MKITTTYKNSAIALWSLVCVIVAIAGCKKLVEIDPPSKTISNADAFSSDQTVAATVTGMYSQLMTNSGSLTFSNGATSIYAGLSSDELLSQAGILYSADYQFETNTLTADNLTQGSILWGPAYRIINTANAIIEGVNESKSLLLVDSARRQATGEAKFVRAFCHFYLTNFFGNVPLVLTTDFNKTRTLTNTPQADVYKQIVDDLLAAQLMLPGDYKFTGPKQERIRANKWAATALLARVYLYQKDWVNAEAQATAVINSGQFFLESNLANVFNMASKEAILQFQQNNTILPGGATQEGYNFKASTVISGYPPADQAQFLDPFFWSLIYTQLIPRFYLSQTLVNAFEANDKRRTTWVDYNPTANVVPWNGANIYFANKYKVYATGVGGAITQYYVVLRMPEQYLIRAEARAQLNNLSGASADLNVIRSRAGLPATTATTQADLLTAIMHERQTELFAEWGHRWFDLKRTGTAKTVLGSVSYKQPFNEFQLLYPIPLNELRNDAFLVQNPGY